MTFKRVGRKPKPKLTLAVDCGSLSATTVSERGGVATVTYELLVELSRLDNKNEYLLYSFAPISKRLLHKFGSRARNRVLPQLGYNRFWLPLAFRFDKPDVFVATAQAPVATDIPTLALVYDVAFLRFPTLYPRVGRLTQNTSTLIQRASHIVTISDASKNDILSHFRLHYREVSVFYPGVSQQFVPSGPKYLDDLPYFLYVGVIKKTKNIKVLLEGFAQYLEESPKKYRLVMVGKNEMQTELKEMLRKLGVSKYVLVKGYVKWNELPNYYRGAVAFVSPALYEGFGLPLVEAMASGTPVIAAKNSAMEEVVGRAGILVSEKKPEDIAKALLTLASDDKFVKKLSKAGLVQSKKYRWAKFARGVLDSVYKFCV